jgi:hypothetical protein
MCQQGMAECAIQEILYPRRLDQPLPFCLIYDLGGVSQRHWFKIIVDLPYVFILDLYVLPSQPADKHLRAPFSFNLLPCWTLPPRNSCQGHSNANGHAANA